MDNILKFLIKLNADKGNVVSVARQTEQQLDTINRKASVVGRGLRKAFSLDGFKGALMSIPGMQFLMNPYTMIGAGVGAMVRLGAQAESVNVAFTTLVGSERKAAEMLGQINDFAAHSPFGKMDLTKSAQTMLNFGVETGKVLPLLRQLGDISGGDKDKMAKGQITYHNVEQAIAHATGAGGKFNGMMDKQSQTLSGKWSTLMDTVQQGAIDLSQSMNTPIAEVVDKITAAIPRVFAVFQAVFSAISAGIGFVVRFRTAFMLLGGAVLTVWAVFRTYTMALAAYQAITTLVTAGTKIWTAAQWLLNVAMTANPIGLIVVGVAALIAIVAYCWTKFAGFRAFLITMWDVWRKFGELIKTYVVDRIKELIRGVGLLSKAFSKLFSGDFKGAAADFAAGVKNVSGVNSAVSLVKSTAATVRGIGGTFQKNLAAERAKDKQKEKKKGERSALSTPGLKGSAAVGDVVFGAGKGTDKAGKGNKGRRSAEEIATGGRRSTSITMNISKFFDTLHVHMTDKADTAELERIVVQSMNRALAIATNTDRG
jgi:hypothetical protein